MSFSTAELRRSPLGDSIPSLLTILFNDMNPPPDDDEQLVWFDDKDDDPASFSDVLHESLSPFSFVGMSSEITAISAAAAAVVSDSTALCSKTGALQRGQVEWE